MITIYTSPSCTSCKKVVSWFKDQDIPFIEKNIFSSVLKEDEIKDILAKSENGTDDIISSRSKIIKDNKLDYHSMSIKQLITFVKDNPSVLKRPIIVDDHRIQVGYNADDITSFMPYAKRLAVWACKNCPDKDNCEHPNLEENL